MRLLLRKGTSGHVSPHVPLDVPDATRRGAAAPRRSRYGAQRFVRSGAMQLSTSETFSTSLVCLHSSRVQFGACKCGIPAAAPLSWSPSAVAVWRASGWGSPSCAVLRLRPTLYCITNKAAPLPGWLRGRPRRACGIPWRGGVGRTGAGAERAGRQAAVAAVAKQAAERRGCGNGRRTEGVCCTRMAIRGAGEVIIMQAAGRQTIYRAVPASQH